MNDNNLNDTRAFLQEALAMLLKTGECWPAAVRVQAAVNALRRRKAKSGPDQRPRRKAG